MKSNQSTTSGFESHHNLSFIPKIYQSTIFFKHQNQLRSMSVKAAISELEIQQANCIDSRP